MARHACLARERLLHCGIVGSAGREPVKIAPRTWRSASAHRVNTGWAAIESREENTRVFSCAYRELVTGTVSARLPASGVTPVHPSSTHLCLTGQEVSSAG